MPVAKDLPVVLFETPDEWGRWIESGTNSSGVWIKFAKKNSGVTSINYDQALRVALCYGWIDSSLSKFDDSFYLQKFSPRRPKSIWSKRNCELAEQLIADGEMQPAGLEQINLAQADGRWEAAYDKPSDMVVPEDFLAALAKNKQAEAFFQTLNKANRYAVAFRLHNAKRPETRAANIQKFITMFADGKKLH